MILRGRDEYNSQDDESSGGEEKEKSKGAYPCDGELLMVRRTLKNQPSMNHETQRDNIFHIRCKVLENTCSIIAIFVALGWLKSLIYKLYPTQNLTNFNV